MSVGRLSELQVRVLRVLAAVEPPWTLTGGAALAGFYTKHRTTRDLDLFWAGRADLGELPEEVVRRLRASEFVVDVVQTAPAFQRLRVFDGAEVVVLDLVADPTTRVEDVTVQRIGDDTVRTEGRHQILVNKLCALLGRSELRDLVDVHALLESGGDLERALADAPTVDGGFSPLTLAWILETFPLRQLAGRQGWGDAEAASLDRFRLALVDTITRAATPAAT